MIKVEISEAYLDVVKAISDAGMAVMAHIGIRPQTIGKLGRLRAEGTTAAVAISLAELADRAVEAGAAALLVEGTAAEAAAMITRRCEVPVIGCGSGPDCDGQILIAPDILGLTQRRPKFAANFANLGQASVEAFGAYVQHVRAGTFPDGDCSYHMKPGEQEQLRAALAPSGRTKSLEWAAPTPSAPPSCPPRPWRGSPGSCFSRGMQGGRWA